MDEGVQQRQLDDGLSMDVIYNEPILLLIGFLLTQAVAWTTFGLVPLVKQFISGVAIGMFVMLSMPSSSGAIPKELVPTFFQSLHRFLPLGQAVDSMRGVLYFNGAGACSTGCPRIGRMMCGWRRVGGVQRVAG